MEFLFIEDSVDANEEHASKLEAEIASDKTLLSLIARSSDDLLFMDSHS